MRTVAEYVESPAILAKLREIGVDYAQGFAIHKPCRIEQLLAHEAA
jgi:EAL domain-containing protein (putative c-di-GMP-specific phosphodiesterase class I)